MMLRARIEAMTERNETQERTITELWAKNCKQAKRIKIQQYIIEKQREPGQPSAIEIADAVFLEITKGDRA